jgi:hypothetical protein
MSVLTKEQMNSLKKYTGKLVHNYKRDPSDASKTVLEIKDTRDLEMERFLSIHRLRKSFNELVLEVVPPHVQSNAALGVSPEQERALILKFINSVKSEYSARKSSIIKADSIDQLSHILNMDLPESISASIQELRLI